MEIGLEIGDNLIGNQNVSNLSDMTGTITKKNADGTFYIETYFPGAGFVGHPYPNMSMDRIWRTFDKNHWLQTTRVRRCKTLNRLLEE